MTNFQFPILQREIQGVLRRKMTFFFAFVFYAILGLAAVYFFAALQHSHTNRGALGRGLFIYVIVLGYPCVGVYAALFSSSLLVAEREKKTLDILLTSPVHGSSVILQKVLAPILTACLLVFGLIPILSLCFMLGGVSPTEFLHQFISLAVWIATCVMIGAWVSAKAKSSAKAIGLTLGALTLLIVIPALTFFYSMVPLFGPRNVGVIIWILAPLFWISPLGNGFLVTFDFIHAGPLFLPNHYFSPPGAMNWILNGLLQLFILMRLSHVWNRSMERKVKVPLVTRLKRYPLIRILLTPLIRRERGPFKTGRAALFDHQGRTLFTRTSRRILDLLTEGFLIAATAFLLAFVAMRDGGPIYGLFFLDTLVVAVFCLGMAMTSFARERDRDTSTLLLITPHTAKQIFMEKWKYYLSFTGKMLVPAWGFPLLLWVLYTEGLYDSQHTWDLFILVFRVAAFIPLATLLAVYGGLVSRQGLAAVVLGGILLGIGTPMILGILAVAARSIRRSSGGPMDDLVLAGFYFFLPILVVVLLSFLLLPGFRMSARRVGRAMGGNFVLGVAFSIFILITVLVVVEIFSSVYPIAGAFRWMAIPLILAGLFLRHLMSKSDFWWIDKMTRAGS